MPSLRDPEIVALLHAVDGSRDPDRDRAIVLLLLDTGIRVSEAASLQVGDLDLAEGRCRVFGKGAKGAEPLARAAGDALGAARRGISLEQASRAASRNGIDMRMFQLVKSRAPKDFGFIGKIAGKPVRTADGRIELSITDLGLRSVRDAVETIAHELNHARSILRSGVPTSEDEDVAETAAELAERNLK